VSAVSTAAGTLARTNWGDTDEAGAQPGPPRLSPMSASSQSGARGFRSPRGFRSGRLLVPVADPGWWTVTGMPADSGGKPVVEILRVALAVVPEMEFHALPLRIVCTRYVDQGLRRVNQPARL
jgi:hypothetical protein